MDAEATACSCLVQPDTLNKPRKGHRAQLGALDADLAAGTHPENVGGPRLSLAVALEQPAADLPNAIRCC